MKQFFVRIVRLFLFLALLIGCHSDTVPSKGSKRSTIVGLLPSLGLHPGAYPWEVDSGDVHEASKRFPKFLRTGRSGASALFSDDDLNRNNGNTMNTGMWFGPRLGRLQKRNSEAQDKPFAYVIFTGENSIPRQFHYARLGKESDYGILDDEDLGQEIRSA